MSVHRQVLLAGAFLAAPVLLVVLQGGCGEEHDEYDGFNYVITGEVWHNDAFITPYGADSAVRESVGGEGLPGATVTVNGNPCIWDEFSREYHPLSFSIPPGDDILVEVELGAFHAAALLTMPDEPIIAAPTGSHDASAPITVQWSTSFVPDHFTIGISGSYTASSTDWFAEPDGALTSYEIPAGTLKPATNDIMIVMYAVNETTSMGPYAGSGSKISATYATLSPAFSTQ
jgi:hypothetical protein